MTFVYYSLSLDEDNLFYVLEEMGSLAGRWRNMCLALGVPDVDTIASRWRDYPKDCLTDVLKQWLKKSYNTQMHGPPTWRKLVGAVANNNGGDNPALAEAIAKNHQCKYSQNCNNMRCDSIKVTTMISYLALALLT